MAKRAFTAAVALLILALVAAGCSSKPAGSVKPGEAMPSPESGMAAKQELTYNLGTEPDTLDPALSNGQPEFTVQNALFEGLVRLDKDANPVPAAAEKWESDDMVKWRFTLRQGLKWSNGDPLTSADFKYAWLRALNPETGSEYSYQLFYILNAEAYNKGEVEADKVGISTPDDRTLEVTLESPVPYFLSLTAFPTYFPVSQKVAEAVPDWAAKPETLVGNGPFKLVAWEHNSRLEMVPNENYWDRDSVKLGKLTFFMVGEESTELTMFETGQLDVADYPPTAEMERLKAEGKVTIGPDLAVYFYAFNVDREPFDDPRVRKAFAYAIDRAAIVKNVTKGGQRAALGIVPPGIPNPATGKDFREEAGDLFPDADVETARRLLREAGYPDGKGLPKIEILYNTSEGHKAIAEAVQEMWKRNLGVTNVVLTNQEWGVYLDNMMRGLFQVARAGWGADYIDPMTFLDVWMKDSGNNVTKWWHPRYEDLIARAKTSTDQKARFDAMHEAERLFMEEMPIIPIYFFTDPYMVKDYVRDVVKYPFGPSIDFKNAWIAKH